MSFQLPSLPYAYNALEPHIDALTMEIHHSRHHQTYVTNLNNALPGSGAEGLSLEDICRQVSRFSAAIRNNGGGHWNHSLFWEIMSPQGGGEPGGPLGEAIQKYFGSFSDFWNQFAQTGATRFGSGWAWLCVKDDKSLCVCSTPNQDNPLMDVAECRGVPILGMDVWEHAYYLKYQNRRPDYIAAFKNVINWPAVEKRYQQFMGI